MNKAHYDKQLDNLEIEMHALEGAVDREEWSAARYYAGNVREVARGLQEEFHREVEGGRGRNGRT